MESLSLSAAGPAEDKDQPAAPMEDLRERRDALQQRASSPDEPLQVRKCLRGARRRRCICFCWLLLDQPLIDRDR